MLFAVITACSSPPDTARQEPSTVDWSAVRPNLATDIGQVSGWTPARTIIHLHSPLSHDACDGLGFEGETVDEQCLSDLRAALCDMAIDVAFVTDHPDHASFQDYEDLLLQRKSDEAVEVGGKTVASRISCDDAPNHATTLWVPGIEDDLMPLGLDAHVADTAEDNHTLYNRHDAEAIEALTGAGALVFEPHTEQSDVTELEGLQPAGLVGVEVFNHHAMFDPDIRSKHLGLGGTDWLTEVGPFLSSDSALQPDLLFLGVLAEQEPSLAAWDALLATGPTVGVGGSDAHQNVLDIALSDGERADSYRRMLRWMTNIWLAESTSLTDVEQAIAAGRGFVAFEVLGTPAAFEFAFFDDGGARHEMGTTLQANSGTLEVVCPTLSPSSPRGPDAPEVTAEIYRDGQLWQTGCGEHDVEGAGVYRVTIYQVPRHLEPFLGDDPSPWMRRYPWIYSNAIRLQ